MTVELLISPPAAGKTRACIQRIRALVSSQPLAKAWVLVPDRPSAVYFRRRLADAGGALNVTVGTFRDLYVDLLEQNGIFMPVIPPALEQRLVQDTVDAAFSAGDLGHYAPIRSKPGFLLSLADVFSELRSARVTPQRFLDYTRDSAPGQRELALLYQRFIRRLDGLNWIDRDGQAWLALSVLERNPRAAAHIRLVVVDGFSAFAGARREFLGKLAQQVGEMLITLPGEVGSTRQVHRGPLAAAQALQQELPVQVSSPGSAARLPQDSAHLAQYVMEPGIIPRREPVRPFLFEARSHSEEAREALRWIKQLNLRWNVPLEQCALFAPNLAAYQPLLRAAAQEFGLPVHFSHPDPLLESPAVLALLALLSLPGEDYKTRALFITLRSPYFNFGLAAADLEGLERVSRQAVIVQGRAQWEDGFQRLQRARIEQAEQLDDERRREDLTANLDLAALQRAFAPFWRLFEGAGRERTLTEWTAWLEALLDGLGYYERVTSQRDREALNALSAALKALVLSESVAGSRVADYDGFLADLHSVLTAAVVEEPREANRKAVLIAGMNEARASRYQAVALLGFSEGLFPLVENPDPFLDETLRRDLGLDPRLQREQASLFFQAFTRADAHLLITRPYLSPEGEAWEASPYWISAKNLFSESAVRRVRPDATRQQCEAASAQELLFWAVQQGSLAYPQDEDLAGRWNQVAAAGRILGDRRARRARGAHEGYADEAAAILAKKYYPGCSWSASRLEQYCTCPFEFFVSSVLNLELKKLPEPGLDAAQTGTLFHRILELVYRRAAELGSVSLALEELEKIAADVFASAPQEQGFRASALWEVEKAQYMETLRLSIQSLEAASAGWTPLAFEAKFGIKNTPDLRLDVEGELVRLHGVVDRIDRDAAGQLRVIDYKTGSSHLTNTDLTSGRRLQMPIYALAAQEALRLGEVVEGFYWQICQAKASSFKLSTYESESAEGPRAAYQALSEHIGRALQGIRAGQFPPRPPSGGCPDYCPAAAWCWRYQGGY